MYVGYSGFPLRVTAVCDKLTLYADGNNVGASSSPEVLSVTVPGQTDVLAVSCEKTSGPGGFLLSTSMGIVTDNSWLCSDTVTDTAWTEKVFDDTAWQQADQIGQNTAGSFFVEYKEIDPYAHWVWYGTTNTVFCRRTISNTPNKPIPDPEMPITKTPSKSDNVSQGQPKASNVIQHEPNIFEISQAELTGA